MADELHLELLGGIGVRQGASPVTGFVSSKALAILCYVAVTARPQYRTALAALFWSELPEAAARMNLRHVLSNLRHVAGAYLVITRDTVAFKSDAAVVDVAQFEAGLSGVGAGEIGRLREAVAFYGGDFLHGFSLRDAPAWDEWVVSQRERLRQLALYALHALVTYHNARGENGAALDYATRLLQLDPWREEAHRQLMLVLSETGQPGAALAQYETCRRMLDEELGVEPDEETTALYDRIRAGEIVPRQPAPVQNNLLVPPTPLIGREAELEAIADLLAQPAVRLLTLLGPGGVGKTRLALEVAASQLPAFAGGVFLVELATVREPARVPIMIAQVLGIRETGEQPVVEHIKAQLRGKHVLLLLDNFEQILPAAPMLSELLAACPALKLLVTSRAALHVRGEQEFEVPPLAVPDFATLPAGQDWSPVTVAPYAAVDLFVRRAANVWPGFKLSADNAAAVAEICSRLDGLPLALELAAARVKLLSPHAIKARLGNSLALLKDGANDLPARQQTLRDAIEWSYELLASDEQTVFRRLAVFVGSCSLDDAQTVCNLDERSSGWIFDRLAVLIDHSLLRVVAHEHGEQRFEMLETIREYATEQLEASGEHQAVRRRHAAHFLRLAELAEPRLQGAGQRSWLDRLELEHDNLRAALRWSRDAEPETALRLAAALGEFWWPRGHLSEASTWLADALERGPNAAPAVRAKALYRAGELAFAHCDFAHSVPLLQKSLALYRSLGDIAGVARVLRGIANSVAQLGDEPAAQVLREEALRQFRKIDDRWGIAWMLTHIAAAEVDVDRKTALLDQSLHIARADGYQRIRVAAVIELARIALRMGELQRAQQLYSECLDLCRELDDRWTPAWPLSSLGTVARDAGDYRRAATLFEQSLLAYRQRQDRVGIALLESHLGDIARWQGDLEAAKSRYDRSMMLFQDMNDSRGMARIYLNQAHLALWHGEAGNAAALYTKALVMLPALRPKVELADYLVALGGVAEAEDRCGRSETAACLFGAVQELAPIDEPVAALVAPADRAAVLGFLQAARSTLAPLFPVAWAKGQAMSLAAAVALAQEHSRAFGVEAFSLPYKVDEDSFALLYASAAEEEPPLVASRRRDIKIAGGSSGAKPHER